MYFSNISKYVSTNYDIIMRYEIQLFIDNSLYIYNVPFKITF